MGCGSFTKFHPGVKQIGCPDVKSCAEKPNYPYRGDGSDAPSSVLDMPSDRPRTALTSKSIGIHSWFNGWGAPSRLSQAAATLSKDSQRRCGSAARVRP